MISVQKLNTITQRVEYCLERFNETRNSDIDLFARLCENFYPPFERPLYNWRDLAHAMHSVPSLDHIAMHQRFLEYVAKFECWDYLEKHDQDFVNNIGLQIRTYLDERIKENGRME